MISQIGLGVGTGGRGEGGGGGGGGNLHPGATIQNCAACSHDLSIVPLGSLQSSLVLLSQYPTEYQQFQKVNEQKHKAKLRNNNNQYISFSFFII